MSEEKKYGFIEGNKYIYAILFAIGTTILQYFFIEKMGLGEIVLSLILLFSITLVFNWLVIKWEIWLDNRILRNRNKAS